MTILSILATIILLWLIAKTNFDNKIVSNVWLVFCVLVGIVGVFTFGYQIYFNWIK